MELIVFEASDTVGNFDVSHALHEIGIPQKLVKIVCCSPDGLLAVNDWKRFREHEFVDEQYRSIQAYFWLMWWGRE